MSIVRRNRVFGVYVSFFLFILSNIKTVEAFIPNCSLLVARETFLNITDCKEPKSKMLKFVRFTGYIDEEEIHDGMQPVFDAK